MPIDSSAIAAEVESWYRESFERPISGKQAFVESVSAVYASPMRYHDLEEELTFGDAADCRTFIQGFSDFLDAAPGWRAEVARIQVQPLNGLAASIVADWRLLDADGNSLAGGDPVQYFYLVSKHAGGWRVVGEATVDAGTRVDFS